jgi:hypothetical protein
MAARDRPARRATRSRTAVPWQGRSRRDLRRGKAEASAGLTIGGKRITMQGDDVQSNDVWRWRPDAVSSEEPCTVSSLNPSEGGEALMARQVGRRSCPSEPMWLCRFVPGIHDIQQLLFLVDRRARPQITVGIILSSIFHPRQPFQANFFVNHGISSSSSSSYRRSCSPREFTSVCSSPQPRSALIL